MSWSTICIRWQKNHNLQKFPTHFLASSYRLSDINIFYFLPLKSRSMSLSAILQWQHSMAKVKNLQRTLTRFWVSAHRFRDNICFYLPSESRSSSLSTIFPITPFDGKNENLQMTLTHLCASSYNFSDIKI